MSPAALRDLRGAGAVLVEMVFLADVYIPCEACEGSRFRRDILDIRIQGLSIADVLQFTVNEAMLRFHHQPRLGQALWQLQQVGLGYLRLGQPATTLSGGEAQRLKRSPGNWRLRAGVGVGSSTSWTSRPQVCTSTMCGC
jgi:excinuclease UvrABC ATPase subunit